MTAWTASFGTVAILAAVVGVFGAVFGSSAKEGSKQREFWSCVIGSAAMLFVVAMAGVAISALWGQVR